MQQTVIFFSNYKFTDMKRILFALLITLGVLQVHAYDYPYLVFMNSDGNTTTLSVETLIITISNGKLVAQNNDGTQSFALSNLNKMYFTKEADLTGISTTENTHEAVEIFTAGGLSVGKFENEKAAKASLKPGLYILKSNTRTYKIAVK